MHYNTLIVLTGTGLLGASAGVVGSFAVLRRRALTGDALAHAALPGICLAFWLFGERRLPALLAGALVTGLLGIGVISLLRQWTRIKEDSAIGIVLGVFFGGGIVLSRMIQNQFAGGAKAGLDSYILGKTAGMIAQDVYLIGGVAAISLLLLFLLYKEFKVVIFDPGFARVQGWPALVLDLTLMALIAVTVVIGLPAVGVVLMAALLIIPGVSARFWTDQLGRMLVISAVFGLSIGLAGTAVSASFSLLPAGPLIVLVGSALFILSLVFAPRRGILARALAHRKFQAEIDQRTLLRLMYDAQQESGEPAIPLHVLHRQKSWPLSRLKRAVNSASNVGLLERVGPDRVRLTPAGLARGFQIARDHRLWLAFLGRYADQAPSVLDLSAESASDVLPPAIVEELIAHLESTGDWPESPSHPASLSEAAP